MTEQYRRPTQNELLARNPHYEKTKSHKWCVCDDCHKSGSWMNAEWEKIKLKEQA